jgi:hypothetical protein
MSCLERLRNNGLIQLKGGRYDVPACQPEPTPMVVSHSHGSAFIAPPSMARLMAGR